MQRSRIRFLTYLAAVASGTLAGCGGGGGGEGAAGPAPAPAPAPPAPAPAPAPRTFAYVATSTSEEIAIFKVEDNGGLSPAGAVTGAHVRKVVIHPTAKLAYAVNAAGNGVEAYSLNPESGMLTLIDSFATGDVPHSLAIHPSGKFAYVSNLDETVSIYSIHENGTLEGKGAFPVGDNPFGIAVHPAGRFLLVGAGRAITSLEIGADGGLRVSATLVGSQVPFAVSTSPDGRFVYVTNGDGTTNIHAIDLDTGEFGAALGVPLSGEKDGPFVFDVSGRFAYLASPNNAAIVALTVLPDGDLDLLQVLQPLPGPNSVATSPSGQALYATNRSDSTVSVYAIEAGRLSLLGMPITVSSAPNGITVASFVV